MGCSLILFLTDFWQSNCQTFWKSRFRSLDFSLSLSLFWWLLLRDYVMPNAVYGGKHLAEWRLKIIKTFYYQTLMIRTLRFINKKFFWLNQNDFLAPIKIQKWTETEIPDLFCQETEVDIKSEMFGWRKKSLLCPIN